MLQAQVSILEREFNRLIKVQSFDQQLAANAVENLLRGFRISSQLDRLDLAEHFRLNLFATESTRSISTASWVSQPIRITSQR